MGLDIYTTDDEKNFHIGYISFSNMRGFFILAHDETSYKIYNTILKNLFMPQIEINELYDIIFSQIGDLKILIDHSDCDGTLTPEECRKLKPFLIVDEEKIMSVSKVENLGYYKRIIEKMYRFIDLVDYAAVNNVDLIFG